VEVELAFALGGHEYRVVRTLTQAEVFLDGGLAPVATGLGGASRVLQSRLGMSREEFFNTYFTGQKELKFLAAMGPADRGTLPEPGARLRAAAARAGAGARPPRRAAQRDPGLRASLGDPEEIAAATDAARRRLEEALEAVRTAKRGVEEATVELRRVEPRWAAAQGARERFRELSHAIEQAGRDREAARRELDRATAELAAVAAAEAELAPLKERLAELPGRRRPVRPPL
jgi:DNA repair protein SbcC/Rad50